MELRHLRYFLAVAEELHFGRAADRLGIRQPPLSQQIRALERDLGVTLFDRSSRTVRLTAAGETLRTTARDVLTSAQAARQATQQAGRGDSGTLVLGFVGSATLALLPRTLRRFRERYPGVGLTLRELTTVQQARALHAGTLDIGLLRPPLTAGDAAGLDVQPLGAERLLVALPADHPLAAEGAVSAERLAGEQFVLFPRDLGPGLYDQITACCRQAGFTPNVVQEAVQMQTIVALVAGGLGVSLVPSSVAGLRRREVAFRPLSPATRIVHLAMARRVGDIDPVVGNFAAVARDVAGRA
ncbi:LysR family transcriptional regulator [Saccharomonospora sp. NPDC046836]|uniref:LysR family transcriptional regulator n=1 Tax=Saccharomonospora sp. NPDC046836 TaxID=3156921 RepID=UPI00340AEEA4